jgi:hypothetical protein
VACQVGNSSEGVLGRPGLGGCTSPTSPCAIIIEDCRKFVMHKYDGRHLDITNILGPGKVMVKWRYTHGLPKLVGCGNPLLWGCDLRF